MDIDFSNMWCWLLPLLCTLLGAIFGYFLGKSGNKVIDNTVDNSADLKLWKDKNAKLQADLDACSRKLSIAGSAAAASTVVAASSLTASTPEPEAPVVETKIPFDSSAASAAYGKKIKEDDLKVVEGIGPKISEMFINAGIKTWKALSETSVADCQKVLDTGGDRYKVHNPASWPLQSKMAYEGKWAELAKWQDEHDHGKL